MIAETPASEVLAAQAGPKRFPWRIVAIFVAFQALILLGGILVFTSLGFGGEIAGGCGGG